MSRSSAIWRSIIIGVLLIGVGIFSIRRTFQKTPASLKGTARQVASGGHLSFEAGEGERIVARLGLVGQANRTKYEFGITNTGLTDVTIVNLEVIKGPVTILGYPKNLAPSAEGKITLEFNPYGLQGAQEAVVKLESNDVKYPSRELVLEAKVSDSL